MGNEIYKIYILKVRKKHKNTVTILLIVGGPFCYFIFGMGKCVSHVCYQLCTKVNLNTLCCTCVYQSQREGFKISV